MFLLVWQRIWLVVKMFIVHPQSELFVELLIVECCKLLKDTWNRFAFNYISVKIDMIIGNCWQSPIYLFSCTRIIFASAEKEPRSCASLGQRSTRSRIFWQSYGPISRARASLPNTQQWQISSSETRSKIQQVKSPLTICCVLFDSYSFKVDRRRRGWVSFIYHIRLYLNIQAG
jgi:hypothetical protein